MFFSSFGDWNRKDYVIVFFVGQWVNHNCMQNIRIIVAHNVLRHIVASKLLSNIIYWLFDFPVPIKGDPPTGSQRKHSKLPRVSTDYIENERMLNSLTVLFIDLHVKCGYVGFILTLTLTFLIRKCRPPAINW